MKFQLILILWLVFSAGLFAQNSATVSGRVFDHGTDQPLPFASVTLNTGTKTVAGTISGEDGRFVFSGVAKGEYKVKCSFIGYQTSEIPLLVLELNKIFQH
jgi:hypothetical protein